MESILLLLLLMLWLSLSLSLLSSSLLSLLSLLLLLLLLLLFAARASADARGVSISWLACAETRVLALCSPEIYFETLRFLFSLVFAVFSSKKCNKRRAALSKFMLSCPFRIVFFGVFLCVSHFALVFAVFLPSLDFLHMPPSTFICL